MPLRYARVLFWCPFFFQEADALNVCENASDTKTNVLIVFADDLGAGDLGMHGGVSQTPNIDRLATPRGRVDAILWLSILQPFASRIAYRPNAALLDADAPQREPFVIAGSDMAIFDGEWKLIQSIDGRLSLFNLMADPQEQNNVWSQNIELGERLKKRLAERTKDFFNLSQRRGPAPRQPRPGR